MRKFRKISMSFAMASLLATVACDRDPLQKKADGPTAFRDVAAVRLNFRYEADVPAPAVDAAAREDRNQTVQADFDANRTQEFLDRTITSPDKKHILAVYRNAVDLTSESRLDMYSPDGKLTKRVTSDAMAVHFPDTITWSPDSRSIAFVAMSRSISPAPLNAPSSVPIPPVNDTNSNTSDANVQPTASPVALPTPAAPSGILTFRTEQIYTCDAEGGSLKGLTQNEGLIYYYYVWSPDSTTLTAMAATLREWKILEIMADKKGEAMVPQGRLRIIEKNGRERRLDDNLTSVRPVWSPDSAKVAIAYETQLRIYDAAVTAPTQAAIPLKNQLLISSQAYDRDQHRKLEAINANSDANSASNTAPPADQPMSTLPNEKDLASFNPIVEVAWPSNDLVYLRTAYLRRMKNDAESVTSFARWHRLVLSPQAAATPSK